MPYNVPLVRNRFLRFKGLSWRVSFSIRASAADFNAVVSVTPLHPLPLRRERELRATGVFNDIATKLAVSGFEGGWSLGPELEGRWRRRLPDAEAALEELPWLDALRLAGERQRRPPPRLRHLAVAYSLRHAREVAAFIEATSRSRPKGWRLRTFGYGRHSFSNGGGRRWQMFRAIYEGEGRLHVDVQVYEPRTAPNTMARSLDQETIQKLIEGFRRKGFEGTWHPAARLASFSLPPREVSSRALRELRDVLDDFQLKDVFTKFGRHS